MADDPMQRFIAESMRQSQQLQAQIDSQRLGRSKELDELGRLARETAQRKEREQKARDDLQRELVQTQHEVAQLQREAAKRDSDRGEEDERRAKDEQRRRRREFGRWCFTTVIAVAGVGHAYGVDQWIAHVFKHMF